MRDYRFFFPAGLSVASKTTDFVSRGTNEKKPGCDPGPMFHVEQSDLPTQLCERIVGCLYNQRTDDEQEEFAYKATPML